MGGLVAKCFFKSGVDKVDKTKPLPSFWSIQIKDIDLNPKTLSEYVGDNKAFIFVNVACK